MAAERTQSHQWPMSNGLGDFLTITEQGSGTGPDGRPTVPVLRLMERHGRTIIPIYADDAAQLGQALLDFAAVATKEAAREGRSAYPVRCPACGRPVGKRQCSHCPRPTTIAE